MPAKSSCDVGGEAQLDHLAGGVPLDQRARRALRDDLAAVHHHEPVAELLGLVHVVRGQHQRHALLLEPEQPLPHQVPGLRVEARWSARRAARSRAR